MDKVHSLSQAMRYGASLRPQGACATFHRVGRMLHSCAIGAATEGIGYNPEEEGIIGTHACWVKLSVRFPEINKKARTACCWCHVSYSSLRDLIYHFNDTHRWSREKIADYLQEKGF